MTTPHTSPLLAEARAWVTTHRADPAAVRAWAAGLLAQAWRIGPPPPAGSPTWRALPDTDPRKLAAVVAAALAWLRESTPEAIAGRLAAELDAIDRDRIERDKAVSADLSAANDWGACGPTHAELQRRRTLTSHLPCGAPGCPEVVTMRHPLPDHLATALPDTTGVRCTGHATDHTDRSADQVWSDAA